MKKQLSRILALTLALLIAFSGSALAHSGRTDSSGGHRDNKNKSGLGSYHYHCGGHPAHLHEDGVCPYAPKDTIKVSNLPSQMNPGDKVQLDWQVTQYSGSSAVEWSSSNLAVAQISSGGMLSAVGEGSAKITAQLPNGQKTFTVKVSIVRVSKITLSPSTKTPAAGTVMHISSAITPANAAVQDLVWDSSNEKVAIPLGDGNILLVGPGKCKITARALDKGKKSASISLNVQKASAPADRESILSQLPEGFAITGKSGSSGIRFAQEIGLPFVLTYPDGLPFAMGSKGEAVKDIQTHLKQLKYFKKNITGTYGKNTEDALSAFYTAHGEVYDSEVSAVDYDWIMSAVD